MRRFCKKFSLHCSVSHGALDNYKHGEHNAERELEEEDMGKVDNK